MCVGAYIWMNGDKSERRQQKRRHAKTAIAKTATTVVKMATVHKSKRRQLLVKTATVISQNGEDLWSKRRQPMVMYTCMDDLHAGIYVRTYSVGMYACMYKCIHVSLYACMHVFTCTTLHLQVKTMPTFTSNTHVSGAVGILIWSIRVHVQLMNVRTVRISLARRPGHRCDDRTDWYIIDYITTGTRSRLGNPQIRRRESVWLQLQRIGSPLFRVSHAVDTNSAFRANESTDCIDVQRQSIFAPRAKKGLPFWVNARSWFSGVLWLGAAHVWLQQRITAGDRDQHTRRLHRIMTAASAAGGIARIRTPDSVGARVVTVLAHLSRNRLTPRMLGDSIRKRGEMMASFVFEVTRLSLQLHRIFPVRWTATT